MTETEWELLKEALVSYGDACTLPDLTPTCPFYRRTDVGATCGEECRELVTSLGVADRPIREVTIGGLVLRGRSLPLTAASGAAPYDATELFLRDRLLPVGEQSTASLLMSLSAAMDGFPCLDESSVDTVMPLWAELERRRIPVEKVVRAAILPGVSSRIGLLASLPALKDGGLLPASASSEALQTLLEAADEGWAELLEGAIAAEGSPEAARQIAYETLSVEAIQSRFAHPDLVIGAGEVDQTPTREQFSKLLDDDTRVIYAVSLRFSNRILEWLSRLLAEEDLAALIRWKAPPLPVFLALPDRRSFALDELGLWIWERFTVTDIAEWSSSSLILEWKNSSEPTSIPPVVWAERHTDPSEIGALALTKLSQRDAHAPTRKGLEPQGFVSAAVRHLVEGRMEEAAKIFEGLVELRPADGDALNNLGFCLLPQDPRRALDILERSSLFPQRNPMVNIANRVLALRLLSRTQESQELARSGLADNPPSSFAYLWAFDDEGRFRLDMKADPVTFLRQVLLTTSAEAGGD